MFVDLAAKNQSIYCYTAHTSAAANQKYSFCSSSGFANMRDLIYNLVRLRRGILTSFQRSCGNLHYHSYTHSIRRADKPTWSFISHFAQYFSLATLSPLPRSLFYSLYTQLLQIKSDKNGREYAISNGVH